MANYKLKNISKYFIKLKQTNQKQTKLTMEQHNIPDTEDKTEYFDAPDVLDKKVAELAQLVLASNHMVCFTGAGISRAAGIPDYRSTYASKDPVGPGGWEIRAKKEEARLAGKAMPVNPKTK